MDNNLLYYTIIPVLIALVIGYVFGLMKKKPCASCQTRNKEIEKLIQEQRDLSKGFN